MDMAPAKTAAERMREYRKRNAQRLSKLRPEQIRELLQELVATWAEQGTREARLEASGAIEFAHRAELIDNEEAETLRALIS